MIQHKFINIIHTGVLGIALAMTISACTDDHFDIPEGGDQSGAATQTLWELISTDPTLSNFAALAAKTPVFKDEKHPMKDYYFKDVLDGNVVLTVFAPNNDALTAADVTEYETLLQESPYDVFLRLTGNHIAKNRYVATGTNPKGKAERVIMLNNKKAEFDREAKTFKDVSLLTPNISAKNGVLHVVGQQIPFAYNIYEYIRANKEYSHILKWFNEHDTLYFDADRSAVAGSDRETGEPIYVDSIYTRYNMLYAYSYEPRSVEWAMPHKGINCDLEAEDSIWCMVLPTDAAWEAAVTKMGDWYNYADRYFDKTKEDALQLDNNSAKNSMILVVKDTLKEAAISMDLISPLVFNVRQQREKPAGLDYWTLDKFLEKDFKKLGNTRLDSFAIDQDGTPGVNRLLFDNQQPIKLSNGAIVPVNNWNFRETYAAMNVEVKAERFAIFQNIRCNLTTAEVKEAENKKRAYNADISEESFNNEVNPLALKYGKVSKNKFLTFSTQSDAFLPKAVFKLRDNTDGADRQILSNVEYEVGIVLVPDFYRSSNELDPEEYPDLVKKNKLTCDIVYLIEDLKENNNTNKWSEKFEYDGQKVDTIWMTNTVTFPYSYRNLSKTYPTIAIQSQKINTAARNQGYQPEFSIDRIILRPKTTSQDLGD